MTLFMKKKVQIKNSQGLHARPASLFVRIANRFESDVKVRKGRDVVDGKSIMGLMTLAANEGVVLEIEVSGPDAIEAMNALSAFLTQETEDGAGGSPKGKAS